MRRLHSCHRRHQTCGKRNHKGNASQQHTVCPKCQQGNSHSITLRLGMAQHGNERRATLQRQSGSSGDRGSSSGSAAAVVAPQRRSVVVAAAPAAAVAAAAAATAAAAAAAAAAAIARWHQVAQQACAATDSGSKAMTRHRRRLIHVQPSYMHDLMSRVHTTCLEDLMQSTNRPSTA